MKTALLALCLCSLSFAAERTVGASIWCDTRLEPLPVQMVIVEDVTFEDGKPFTAVGRSISNGNGTWKVTYDATITLAEDELGNSPALLHYDLKVAKWEDEGKNGREEYAASRVHILWDTFAESGVGYFRNKAGAHKRLICVVGYHTKKN